MHPHAPSVVNGGALGKGKQDGPAGVRRVVWTPRAQHAQDRRRHLMGPRCSAVRVTRPPPPRTAEQAGPGTALHPGPA